MNRINIETVPVCLFLENYAVMQMFFNLSKDQEVAFIAPISNKIQKGDNIAILEPHYRIGFWDAEKYGENPSEEVWFFTQTEKKVIYADLVSSKHIEKLLNNSHRKIPKEAGLIVETSFPANVMLVNESRLVLSVQDVELKAFDEITELEAKSLGAPMAKKIGGLTFMQLPFEEMCFIDGLIDWFHISFSSAELRKSKLLFVKAKIVENGK